MNSDDEDIADAYDRGYRAALRYIKRLIPRDRNGDPMEYDVGGIETSTLDIVYYNIIEKLKHE